MTPADLAEAPVVNSSLPDGYVPMDVAPFVMRYGTDVLRAMRSAALVEACAPSEAEPA